MNADNYASVTGQLEPRNNENTSISIKITHTYKVAGLKLEQLPHPPYSPVMVHRETFLFST